MTGKSAKITQRHLDAASAVLNWYDSHRRHLPWRAGPGQPVDPYRVWLSEVMLQQTTVATVRSAFAEFTRRWPGVADLAAASRDEVMEQWAGLGYYARARNLHACAVAVVNDHGGVFPDTEDELRKLPGVGAYTAAAVAAIAFGRRAVVMDGNIERVAARWQAITTLLPAAKPEIHAEVDALTPDHRAGDFAQAMMDIGATICTPARKSKGRLSQPDCDACPLFETCMGRQGDPALLPMKKPKTPRPDRFGVAVVAEDEAGNILLERRGDKGMLGGMLVFPGSNWADGTPAQSRYPLEDNQAAKRLLEGGEAVTLNGNVEHIFSHFRVILMVIRVKPASGEGWLKVPKNELSGAALPTVMRKVARLAGLEAW
ncbi:MAG: Adenine DNA glycosylase [SAR116 cluster bacterium MED-G04]|nr:MAG: Adenine DNA glycosylase [SAR116 cluster bacterium MED-G04]